MRHHQTTNRFWTWLDDNLQVLSCVQHIASFLIVFADTIIFRVGKIMILEEGLII